MVMTTVIHQSLNMQNGSPVHINLDVLVQQIVATSSIDPQATVNLRNKLNEQLIEKCPRVELEHLDLKCIIMNVKKSLSEFQKRIDDSVVQQQLRRTARVRKSISQDPAVLSFFNRDLRNNRKRTASDSVKIKATCSENKYFHQMPDLSDLVQVESLPVSASTNLLTIFVPSILQEKMNSCKYKISIDLNRLDLTKKILDINLDHRVNSNLETKTKDECKKTSIEIDMDKICRERDSYEANINKETRISVETQTTDIESEAKPELDAISEKTTNEHMNPPALVTTVSIQTEDIGFPQGLQRIGRKRGPKRKEPKPPTNDPPKKRGRKPGSKNKNKKEKSDLVKYVEMFACNTGSPSAVSQIVTSTTQNWDIAPDETGQIAYFMNGQWTVDNQSIVERQMVSTTNETVSLVESVPTAPESFIPFEDFVNFIENPSLEAEHNVIARVLDNTADVGQNISNMRESNIVHVKAGGTPTEIVVDTRGFEPIKNQIPSTSKSISGVIEDKRSVSHNLDDVIVSRSTLHDEENAVTSDSALDVSKDCALPLALDIMDLTQRRPISPLQSEPLRVAESCEKDKSIVFSASMPLLDMEADMFCSTPQRGEDVGDTVVFSIAPQPIQSSPMFMQNSCHSAEVDSNVDSAIDVDRRGTFSMSSESLCETPRHSENPISLKRRTMPEAMKGMSLLEIEKDIDDSLLDFDNYLDDDLLSLAPSSCFNSPNPDRSADADLLDTSEPAAIIKKSSPLRIQIETNSSQCNQDGDSASSGKGFKIPRKIFTSELTTESPNQFTNSSESKSKQPVRENYIVSPSPSLIKRSPIRSPKLSGLNVTSSTTTSTSPPRDIPKMFGSLCYGFLSDKCFSTSCRFSHQFLDRNVIKTSLTHLRIEDLNSAYRYVWRHYKLFQLYFPVFCEEYARRNLRSKLASMINDCEMQPLCLPYLRNIHSVLMAHGLNKVNACRFILNYAKARTQMAIDILLEIIIESGAIMFSTVIAQFTETLNYKFRMKDINEMAAICLRSGNADLITVLIKCLISVDQTEFVTMRSSELVQILEMVRNGNFGRM